MPRGSGSTMVRIPARPSCPIRPIRPRPISARSSKSTSPAWRATSTTIEVEVSFTRRLRGHMPFPDAATASAQIARDTAEALKVDAQEHP